MIRAFIQRLLRLIFHNLGYKLLSILLAVIVWAIIQGEQVQEVSSEVHVSIHVPAGFGVRGEALRIKAATVRGPHAWLLEVPKKLIADVYLSSGRVGAFRVRVSKDDVKNLNERLELVIHEPYLDLYVDHLIERTLPIKESLQGSPADGFMVEKVLIEPSAVKVKGIRADILKLRSVATDVIDVSEWEEGRTLPVKLATTGFGEEALAIDTVQVSIKLSESKINKRFSGIPVEVSGALAPSTVNVQNVSILVQGVPGVVNALKNADFKALVEVGGIAPGRHQLPIKIKLPEDTTLLETMPEKGLVTIEKPR